MSEEEIRKLNVTQKSRGSLLCGMKWDATDSLPPCLGLSFVTTRYTTKQFSTNYSATKAVYICSNWLGCPEWIQCHTRVSSKTPAYSGAHEFNSSTMWLYVCYAHPYLVASPDGAIYVPSTPTSPFGFLEVKCPYKHRNITPEAAGSTIGFFCLVDVNAGGSQQLILKTNHPYYA